ncbi:zonadhesin [Anolis sagrei]|uniref:zonadhesin n=1 Tax=Anolis sagrei TaxID=38937 RepID=UPI003522EE6B
MQSILSVAGPNLRTMAGSGSEAMGQGLGRALALQEGSLSGVRHCNPRGYYIYPEAGKTVQLQSPALDPDAAEICVEFLYYLYSFGANAQLAVKVQDASGNTSTLWTKGGMQSSSWLLGTVTVQNPVRRPFQVVFAATRAENTEIDMGLDSISIRVGPCSPCVTGCDFDSMGDLCGWENPAEEDIQWEQWTGAGDNPDVGPADDFSKPGFGSYMLLDSFDSKNSGTALLKSPPYESQGGCLSLDFYYTLHGVSSDTTLKVYAVAVAGGGLGAPLLTLSGEHGPNWNPGVVNYTGTAEVQFVFEGTYRGKPGLAVDSIHVSPCEEVFTQCDFNDNANPFCGWVGFGDNDDVSWTRTNHSTPTEETGPPGDYPDGKGYYIYAEGGSLKPGQSLRLTSRAFCTDTEACVEFYYYMYGIVEVQTQLRVLLEGPSGAEVTLWTRSGIQSPAWLLGSVTVPYGGPQPSRVLFEVIRGSHPYLDVSLDNISVRRGPCSGSGTPLPPTTSSIATSTHAGPVVTLPSGSPVTSRSTTASPVPTSHVVPTTHSNTTPQKPTLTSPTTTTTASISTATTRDSHVSSTAPATSGQGSQTTPGVPKPTSHPTSDAPSTSKASTTSTTASHGSTTTTPTPTTSISKTSTTSTTTSQGDTTTTPTPTTSVSKTSTASTTASHGSTTTTATITTSDSKTTTTSTTASQGSTTTTPAPTTSISKTSTTSTTTSHGSTTTTAAATTSDSKASTTSTTAIHSTPAPTTIISKTSTTSTTASHSNTTTTATTTTSSTHHTQLPITSQTSTTHGSTTSTTPAPTSQGNLTTRTTSPATISTTSDSKTSTTSTTAAQGSTTVATRPSTTRGPTQLPITSPTSGSQPSTTTGHTSQVPTAGSSSTSHPSVTTARPTPPKGSTTATTHISPSTSPSHNQTSTTQGSPSSGHTTTAPSTTRQTTPITTTKVTIISTTTISSSPTTHTAGQPTTTSGTTLQANTTITQSATTLTTSPHTSPTTLAPDSLTSRPPSPTVSRTTTLGKTTTTAPLMTSSVSPSTLHTTTVGHVTTTSITASTKSTPTTPGSGHSSPTTVGHTSPSSTHTSATSIAITTTTGSGTPSLTTITRPPIRTTTTQHTTSLATIESSRTTVTTTERSSTKMPVSPEATTTTTTLLTTTAKPTPTQGASIGTTVTSTAPVAPPGQGICTISGDPHYTTYDGRLFHFMGTCTYLLSSVCNATAGLPTFRVQATNEHRGANKQVSYVKSVSVEVYGTEIVLLKARRVTVNGQRVTLPVSLAEDRVWVRLSGTFVLVQTDFGLSVRFDGNHHAEVSVPPSYYGYLCGLCGNYNGEVSDDNLMPDGTSAGMDADKLGESWQVPDPGDEGCSNTGDPGECDKDLAAEAEKPSSCGILTDPQGPFFPCHSKIPPEGFFESCVYDFCGTGGDEGTLCFALQSYADRCAQAGVNIAWRNSSFCPLSCPPGSSYAPCTPACPATCLDGPSKPSCPGLSCLEGCICDEGLVLSGETCVPIDQCGCTDTSGQYHPVGESWMADSNCTERCTCGAQNNITCQEWSCSPIQECRPQEGLLGCQDTGVAACHVAGDPHYYTFDGTMVSFMGTCTYTLVALCQSDPRLPSFTITAKNEERGQPEASYLRQVTLQLHGYTVTLQKSRRVLIDGQRVRTPVEGRIPGVSITSSGIYVILETNFGLVMKFDGNHHLEIQLPGTYFDKVCGMCGNFNNQSQDDLLMPNGHLAANDSQFGNSWKAPGDADPGCQPDDREDLEPPCSPAEMERLSALCGEILGPKYQPCHGVINPQLFVQNCLFDLCEYDGMASVLCDNVQSYVEACKSQGVTGLSWRNSTFCPLPCPPHSHYTECASPCPATCCNLYAPAACQSRTTCVEGCTCDRGYVLSDDTCVSARDCGCLDSQHEYHSPGDTWVTPNCREHCTCLGSGEISCRAFECLPGSTCALSSTGQRFCKPGDFHQCVISGDPHYRTFDRFVHHFQGRSTYTLSRTLPGLPSVLVPFSVAGRNRRRFPFHRFSFLREVYVSVYDYSITFMQRRKLVVNSLAVIPPFATPDGALRISQGGLRILLQTDFELAVSCCLEHLSVNGLAVTPPFATPDGALRISQRGLRILLQTDFGLAVSFDGRDFAEITLPSTYQNSVGGLCGNYDGRRNNEYMRPDGTWTRSLNTFGNSWQVSVQREMKAGIRTRDRREEPSEDDDVETGFDITCSSEQLMFVNGTDMCGALSDPVGPFSACHSKVSPDTFQESCVYDLCALFNDTELLCQDYEAYAQLCQEERVPLETWRRQTGCEVSCPPHTTYQPCMTACPASCANMAAPSDCESPCMEGCASNTGYVLSGLDSVPYNQCGCTRNDQYYQINDSFWTEDCSQHCVCRNTGTLECQVAGCAPGEACALANFTRGCFRVTPCLSSPCQNEGTCVDESEGFLCLCPEGYFGPQCEEALQDEAPTTAPPLRPTTSSPPTGKEEASQLVPILLGVLIPLGIILIVTAIVCICRHRNRKKAKEDRIAVLSAPGQPSTLDAFGNRITRF